MTLPDCEKCGNARRVRNDDGDLEPCDCVVTYRIKSYLSPIGKFKKPSSDVLDELDKIDDPLNNVLLKLNTTDIKLFNGVIAYLVKRIYPTDYDIKNIYELHVDAKEDNSFGDLLNYDNELMIVTAGLPEEYEGWTKDGTKWTDEAYSKTGKQVIAHRLKFDLPSWYVTMKDGYEEVEDYLRDNDFHELDFTESSNRSTVI